jgi:hypothetical protein
LSYRRYIPRIYLSYDIWIFGGLCLAREHAGAAMFMRSTPGYGTFAGLSLESMDF